MERNKELFQRTFSRLKASPESGKELLAMMEQAKKPKKFALRRLAVAAAVLALAVALAMGANAATGGEMFGTVLKYVTSFTMDGSKIDMYEGKIDGETVFFSIDKQEIADEDGEVTVRVEDPQDGGKSHYTVTEYDGENSMVLESGEAEDFSVEKFPEAEVSSVPEE